MSNLTQFAPFAGGGLKSLQTGYVRTAMSGTGTGEDARFFDITISSVSTAKAIPGVYGSFANGYEGAYSYDGAGSGAFIVILLPRLTSSTNLRLSSNQNLGALNFVARWYVAEAN